MGAQSVFHVARVSHSAGLVVALLTWTSLGAAQDTPLGPPAEPPRAQAIVIDLAKASAEKRAEATAAAKKAIAQSDQLALVDDKDLEAALVGNVTVGAERRGRDAAKSAQSAATCMEATAAAKLAVLELAAFEASGADVRSDLRGAYSVAFRCAVERNDAAAALGLAQILRSLGQVDPPAGVDSQSWGLYPELDAAANVTLAAVTIESTPPGAEVWIDHVRRGVTPLSIHILQGGHLVAISAPQGIAAKTFTVEKWTHRESLTPRPTVGRWSNVAALVAKLRSGRRAADAGAIADVLALSGAELALVIVSGGTIEAWQAKSDKGARRLGQRRNAEQAAGLLARTRAERAPDPNVPLLRETDAERVARANRDDKKPTKWWVYAAVAGAAAVGAGIIILGSSGEDRQRIEITLP